MAVDFYARMMHESDNKDNLPNHQIFALFREYARNRGTKVTPEYLRAVLNVSGSDSLFTSILSYIDAGYNEYDKINRVSEIEDIFLLHENSITNFVYPTRESLRNRLGI